MSKQAIYELDIARFFEQKILPVPSTRLGKQSRLSGFCERSCPTIITPETIKRGMISALDMVRPIKFLTMRLHTRFMSSWIHVFYVSVAT